MSTEVAAEALLTLSSCTQTIEWTGGQIKDDDDAEDIKTVDLKAVRADSVLGFCSACHQY